MLHYLNNAGAGLMSSNTLDVIIGHLQRERNIGAYLAAQESRSQIEEFYNRAANLVNAANPNEIAFMDSASRGWNMALHGAELCSRDHIVTLASEFGTNLITLFDRARQVGATVQVIQCDSTGNFSIDEVATALNKGARMIAISHAAAHGSIVNPVHEIGTLAKQYGAIYIVDGCQAVGQIPVDVRSIQCDAYISTGRKWLCGPRGTGFLYIRASSPFRTPQLDLASADLVLDTELKVLGVDVRTDARQFELWERNVASMIGLSSAMAEYLEQNQSTIAARIHALANRLRTVVSENSNLNLLGRLDSESGIVGFYLTDPTREESVRDKFEQEGLGISTMNDWDCPLHFPRNGATTIFRLSPHHYTPDSSVITACEILSKI